MCTKWTIFLLGLYLLALASCSTIEVGSNCLDHKVTLGSAEFQVSTSYFTPSEATKKSIVIIPPTGGTNAIDRSYARQFCRAGYQVAIINGWSNDQETKTDIEIHQHFYSGAQKAVQIALLEIKTPFVGLLGTSVGALHAAISANSIDRFNAVFLIAGGADISEVIVTSDQKAMVDLKKARKNRFGFKDDSENMKAIDSAFTLEPMKLGTAYLKKDIGMVIASGDHTVPTATQIKLKDFFKPTTLITLNNDHFWAIVKSWLFHSGEILEFFDTSSSKTSKI